MSNNANISHIRHITDEIKNLSFELYNAYMNLKIQIAKCEGLKYDLSDLESIYITLKDNLSLIYDQIRLENTDELFKLLLVLKSGLYKDHLESLNLQIIAMKKSGKEEKGLSEAAKGLALIMKNIEDTILNEEKNNQDAINNLIDVPSKTKVLNNNKSTNKI